MVRLSRTIRIHMHRVTPSLTKGSVFAASSAPGPSNQKKNVNIQIGKGTRLARDSDFGNRDIFLFKQLPQRYDTYIVNYIHLCITLGNGRAVKVQELSPRYVVS